MDVQLARTFLAIIAEGNFGAAAASLHVTQSAVSLRVKRLEELLGQRLFKRNKSGVELTTSGRQFERFAISLVRVWQEARHQVAVPDGYAHTMIIGGQYSLLPRLVMRWLDLLEPDLPDYAFRVESGMPERLMRLLLEGGLDIAVLYSPQLRPGFNVEKLFDEELVLVSADPDFGPELNENYVYIDWGADFAAAHAAAYPDLGSPRLTLATGALGLNSIIRRGRAGYFPARVAREDIAAGRLHLVTGAPSFASPCYVIYNTSMDQAALEAALRRLKEVVAIVDDQQEAVLNALNDQ